MLDDFHEYIERIGHSADIDELKSGLLSVAHKLEFEDFAYGVKSFDSFPKLEVELINSYTDEWNDLYHSQGFVAIDPVIAAASSNTAPLVWQDYSKQQPEMWDLAKEYGVSSGWSKSTFRPSGIASLFSLVRSQEIMSESEIAAKTPLLLWVNNVAEQSFERLLSLHNPTPINENLTPRELEILKWTAEGKTTGEIAIILNITERTATFHIGNAMRKLNATNKTSAVVRAVLCGLLK
ncbi:autoinducer binding domain-containing protein [Vibrio sp. SCSIO 43136]|uniref:autoinducer binding domain-containing protein n=1 Tax=Vibrio sp. SCSIO 43136 TaxID=2819101 RepID=UPI002075DFF4|nr:autoinducer binding domain-containing protein [Vibrio sp. SCSIO 43136]USD67216.1 autoinducer binding domain-containing protein [Vibrio sp. SCSIO 43136]